MISSTREVRPGRKSGDTASRVDQPSLVTLRAFRVQNFVPATACTSLGVHELERETSFSIRLATALQPSAVHMTRLCTASKNR